MMRMDAKEGKPMALMEFSMIPLDRGSSFSAHVARTLGIVDASGLKYRLNFS